MVRGLADPAKKILVAAKHSEGRGSSVAPARRGVNPVPLEKSVECSVQLTLGRPGHELFSADQHCSASVVCKPRQKRTATLTTHARVCKTMSGCRIGNTSIYTISRFKKQRYCTLIAVVIRGRFPARELPGLPTCVIAASNTMTRPAHHAPTSAPLAYTAPHVRCVCARLCSAESPYLNLGSHLEPFGSYHSRLLSVVRSTRIKRECAKQVFVVCTRAAIATALSFVICSVA